MEAASFIGWLKEDYSTALAKVSKSRYSSQSALTASACFGLSWEVSG